MSVYRYIEEHYKDGELSELAQMLHYDVYWLSRAIHSTGATYTELVQQKRYASGGISAGNIRADRGGYRSGGRL